MSEGRARDIVWIGSTKRDLRAMPAEIQDAFGYALDLAQRLSRADYARPMSGDLRAVIEIRAHDDTGKNIFRKQQEIERQNQS